MRCDDKIGKHICASTRCVHSMVFTYRASHSWNCCEANQCLIPFSSSRYIMSWFKEKNDQKFISSFHLRLFISKEVFDRRHFLVVLWFVLQQVAIMWPFVRLKCHRSHSMPHNFIVIWHFIYFALKENNREKMRNVVFIIRNGMKTATWEFATGSLYGSWHGRRPAFKHFSEIEKLREIDEEKVELIRDVARILKRDWLVLLLLRDSSDAIRTTATHSRGRCTKTM